MGIYVENSHELKDLTPGLIVLSLIVILVFVINLYARQRFIQTVDVETCRNTRISIRQKIGFIAIGIVLPVIAALIFLAIGTDTKNIKFGELAIIPSVIFLSVLFPVLLILITYL